MAPGYQQHTAARRAPARARAHGAGSRADSAARIAAFTAQLADTSPDTSPDTSSTPVMWDVDDVMDDLLRRRLSYFPRMMQEVPGGRRNTARAWDLRRGRTSHGFPGDVPFVIGRNVGPGDPLTVRADTVIHW